MRKVIDISSIQIRDYAFSYGWELVREGLKDGLFVLNSPNKDYKQLIFPTDSSNPDFQNMALIAIRKLGDFSNQSEFKILEDIREVNDDVLNLRYFSESKIVNALSFQETVKAIDATKQLILTAGSSVVHPSLLHKRLFRNEANELLRKTKFRHTEEGSFILKISCPVELERSSSLTLFDDEVVKPLSRRAFELMNYTSKELLNAIEADSIDQLIEAQVSSSRPSISYNFCDALINLFDDERELPFELIFNWSRAYMTKLPPLNLPRAIKFPYEFKPKLEEIKSYLNPIGKELEDTFFGTVESLNGNEGGDGRRSGEVMLALLIDSEIVNARVELNSVDYETAWHAHGEGGSLIKIRGILFPGKRVRTLENVSLFERIYK
ncbi:hypothetical protein [Chitinophaga sp. ARDCPP14]|uniref:hypothetical protein n=1 Tax=Chitinophaga sp. ARDCPP14 TaxID=3391139 RepID=UPI003F52098B